MSNNGIHQFWIGIGTKYGCDECEMAGDTPDDIDHDADCSVDTGTEQSEGGNDV